MTSINPHDVLRLKLMELDKIPSPLPSQITKTSVQQFIDDTAELLLWAEKCLAHPPAQLYRFPIESAIPRGQAQIRSLRMVRQKLQFQEYAI